MTSKNYIYNKHGICENPDRVQWRDPQSRDYWEVATAHGNGAWRFAICYAVSGNGFGQGVRREDDAPFRTQLDATVAGVKLLYDRLTHCGDTTAKMLQSIREQYSTLLQKELF